MATATRGTSLFSQILREGRLKGITKPVDSFARDWFRERAMEVGQGAATPTKMIEESPSNHRGTLLNFNIGQMFLYNYDPKWKKELPYYDRFPLIFVVKVMSDRFHGINLHYLPPLLRARLMDALYDVLNNKQYNDTTRLKISYQILNNAAKYRYFKPTFKEYLFKKVKSKFLYIRPNEWEVAMFLPLQRFSKASTDRVWKDSREMIFG